MMFNLVFLVLLDLEFFGIVLFFLKRGFVNGFKGRIGDFFIFIFISSLC